MQCAEHPKVETNLRCGKCEKPICPKCMVQTPVGARCKSCARMRKLPMFEVSAAQYAVAVAVGVCLSVVVGAVWSIFHIPFISFWIPLGVGYLEGEVIGLSVNRKRTGWLQVIVGLSVVATYFVSRLMPYLLDAVVSPAGPLGATSLVGLGAMVVIGTVTQPYALLILALGVYLGVTRVR